GDLKEVTAGKSFDYEELLRSSIFGVICRMWIQVCQSATGPRTVAISRINEKLEEMRLDGK
ncbi:MAG: hypothetical protein J6I74_03710, partial [Schwartzia sp.]|nr:hypothetical protein [Schwartzia sp. (in: firmicutes)]